jgi:hypothetical protein
MNYFKETDIHFLGTNIERGAGYIFHIMEIKLI